VASSAVILVKYTFASDVLTVKAPLLLSAGKLYALETVFFFRSTW
jgi:hypothetical protein